MDEQVLKAMARWPNVPAVHGWLRLDRRGGWHLVDRGRPGFDESRDRAGSPITSPPIVDFIHRNYTHDESGRWYWQNGPQRVYVDLDCAPLVFRVFGEGRDARLVAHTGEPVSRVDAAWTGPAGEILLATDIGPGVVHDLDLGALEIHEGAGGLELALGERRLALGETEDPPRALGFAARPRP
ncbi:DUF2946 family protein [Burkholderiaceae bacterium FT117]|uniref:DUF2946 family protein n=1 Tax=Zeimonas sediminis TaxID=2944268 RepID=UPI002342CDD8|nr:DUF2946 family protein [Zeimonas sediminis]MCM5570658.1 DUF2946 family protein [Zeimonas sediminis]